ncbi:hypothetical protein PJP10_32990, partial [Mycobacterium kansasii]
SPLFNNVIFYCHLHHTSKSTHTTHLQPKSVLFSNVGSGFDAMLNLKRPYRVSDDTLFILLKIT